MIGGERVGETITFEIYPHTSAGSKPILYSRIVKLPFTVSCPTNGTERRGQALKESEGLAIRMLTNGQTPMKTAMPRSQSDLIDRDT